MANCFCAGIYACWLFPNRCRVKIAGVHLMRRLNVNLPLQGQGVYKDIHFSDGGILLDNCVFISCTGDSSDRQWKSNRYFKHSTERVVQLRAICRLANGTSHKRLSNYRSLLMKNVLIKLMNSFLQKVLPVDLFLDYSSLKCTLLPPH